ncbi:hypothetical protein AAG570_013317 [Ranatra chinensis]|uniref:Uncharacterized protein n=1 Tax=Ranatra chinensis TaxID=642074 RepID=A0ABD0Z4Q9_9HEMI
MPGRTRSSPGGSSWNSLIHTATGFTPFEAVFGETGMWPVRHRTAYTTNARQRHQEFNEIEKKIEAEKVARDNEQINNDTLAKLRPGDAIYKASKHPVRRVTDGLTTLPCKKHHKGQKSGGGGGSRSHEGGKRQTTRVNGNNPSQDMSGCKGPGGQGDVTTG